jgi:hypothetical protein
VDAIRSEDASVRDLVEWVRALPYGRPSRRTVEAMLEERRGTCSTKHLYLAEQLALRCPLIEPQIIHRVYRLTRQDAQRAFGADVAAHVPTEGVVDVHRYLTARIEGRQVVIDATFPSDQRWDGRSSMPLACGPGIDYPAGSDPDADKRMLEQRHCDPSAREPLIAALTDLDTSRPSRSVSTT